MLLSIGQLASALGVSVVTLRRWDKSGALTPKLRTAGGHRRYLLSDALQALGVVGAKGEHGTRLVVGYARVSSSDQKMDLTRQTERLRDHLKDIPQAVVITDLGSGLNFKKRGLTKLLSLVLSGQVERLVVTHKDRLLRFGFELLEQLVTAHGGKIEVLEDVRGSDDVELAKDVLAIITVFSARLYGRRSHQHREQAA
jgi:putative resolvase